MRPRGSSHGRRIRRGSAFLHLLAASAWLYGALLVLYPEAFRRRYEAEMRRDFRELSREGLQEGGTTELVGVWVQAFWDLVLTALKERSTLLAARSAYSLAVDPRIAVRAMVVAVVLVAVAVTLASSTRTPTYEASAQLLVDQKQGDQQTNLAGTVEGLQTIILTMIHAIDSRPVAEEAIRRLGLRMEPDELSVNLTFEQVKSTNFIRITYKGNDPVEATKIVNTVGEVSSEFISKLIAETRAADSQLTANVYEKAMVPETPVSPHPWRNGLLTLVVGLVLSSGLALPCPGPCG